MSFANYIKTLKLETIDEKYIPYSKIKCQYNPDRYKYWLSACGPSLKIKNGPYWEYLNKGDANKYWDLFRGYGRNDLWIVNNILKFNSLYGDIHNNGFDETKGLPIVLEKPIVKNNLNCGFELWEGHRRLSICQFLNIEQKVKLCRII